MSIFTYLLNHKDIISLISDLLTAFGTVGAVIVALWFSYRDNKPKLKVSVEVAFIFSGDVNKDKFICFSCININKQAVLCTGFRFNPNKYRKCKRVLPHPKNELKLFPTSRPAKMLNFSEGCQQYFNTLLINDPEIRKLLGNYKWIAKIRLKYFWRVAAKTNIGEFNGKLSRNIIEEFLISNYSKN